MRRSQEGEQARNVTGKDIQDPRLAIFVAWPLTYVWREQCFGRLFFSQSRYWQGVQVGKKKSFS